MTMVAAERPVMNEWFSRKIGRGRTLVTTRHGSWLLLGTSEMDELEARQPLSKKLAARLEKAGVTLAGHGARRAIEGYVKQYSFISSSRMLCIVNVTGRCNQRCLYCHADSAGLDTEGLDMSRETAEKVIDFICGLPHREIGLEFQGGEPLASFDIIKKVVAELDRRAAKVDKKVFSRVVVSNLGLMDKEKAQWFLENDVGLGSSLDGPKELHDSQRILIGGSSYENVIRWARFFRRYGREVGLLPVITKKSIEFGARAMVDEYAKLGLKNINLKPVQMMGRASDNDNLAVGAEEFFSFWRDAVDYMVELTNDGRMMWEDNAKNLLVKMLAGTRPYMCSRWPCGAGTSQFSFGHDGAVHACDLMKSRDELALGNVRTDSPLEVVMTSVKMAADVPEFRPLCDSCAFAAFCSSCRVQGMSDEHRPGGFDCVLNKKMLTYIFRRMEEPAYRQAFGAWLGLGGAS